jgi:hypothetical protein
MHSFSTVVERSQVSTNTDVGQDDRQAMDEVKDVEMDE